MRNKWWWFKGKKSSQPCVKIVESSIGTWHYHLQVDGHTLCGEERVMATSVRIESWGYKSEHIPESYCKECDKKARELGILGIDREP